MVRIIKCAQLYQGESATAHRCQQILDTVWLSRYPIGFGNGSEFQKELRDLCKSMGMKPKVSLPWNPQPNAILERVHQVLGDALRTFEIDPNEEDPFEEYRSDAAYAARSSFHATHWPFSR